MPILLVIPSAQDVLALAERQMVGWTIRGHVQRTVVRARRLIERQEFFEPEQLLVVTSAFEDAWELMMQASFVGEANREAGRLRLANLVIDRARRGVAEREQLVEMAVEAMHRPLH